MTTTADWPDCLISLEFSALLTSVSGKTQSLALRGPLYAVAREAWSGGQMPMNKGGQEATNQGGSAHDTAVVARSTDRLLRLLPWGWGRRAAARGKHQQVDALLDRHTQLRVLRLLTPAAVLHVGVASRCVWADTSPVCLPGHPKRVADGCRYLVSSGVQRQALDPLLTEL
jgi:hypothetical protein